MGNYEGRQLLKVEYEKEGNLEITHDHDQFYKGIEQRFRPVRRKDGDR